MKRNLKIAILSCILLILMAAIVYATQVTTPVENVDVKKVSTQMLNTSSEILSVLDSEETIKSTSVKYDNMRKKDIYEVSTSKYIIDLDSTNNLVGIYTNTTEPIVKRTRAIADKDSAREVILAKYQELNLPSDYELVYLEKLDDEVWEADFQKNYNGIYNKYEAVKTFFIPENNEIVSLTVFNEGNDTTDVAITADDAILTAANSLNIETSDIVSSTLTMEKANKFYDESNNDSSVHTTWVLEKADNSKIYVDATDNVIIGGNGLNE